MSELVNANHQIIMQVGFSIMLVLSFISISYMVFVSKTRGSLYIIFANMFYFAFFLFTSLSIGKDVFQKHTIVAFLDLSANIFWMMALGYTISKRYSKELYSIFSVLNIVLVYVVFDFSNSFSAIRAITAFLSAVIILESSYKYFKAVNLKKYRTYRILGGALILYALFKVVMSILRWYTVEQEVELAGFKEISSVNTLTLISILFAILVNFGIVFLDYDKLNYRLRSLSMKDELTSLPNRRLIFMELEACLNRVRDKDEKFLLVIFDLDHFKNINDTYGHVIGDEMLKDIALVLKKGLREEDFVGRYGGEEFIAIIHNVSREKGREIIEDMMKVIRSKKYTSLSLEMTVSGGCGFIGEDRMFDKVNDLIKIVDDRLYKAKQSGRNQIIYWD